MGDLQYWDDTLAGEIESVRGIVQSIPQKRDDMEKTALIDKAERMIRSADGTKRSYKMEIRLLTDPNERRRYETELVKHENALKDLTDDVATLRSEMNRGELFLGADAEGGSPEADGDALLNEASRIQDKTQNSLDNTRAMVAESKEVGMETMEELRRQREQINTINEEAMKMEDNLVRADKLIKNFGRRMATDKFIQCFACVNLLLLVGVIVYAVLKQGSIQLQPEAPTQPWGGRRMLRALVALPDDEDEVEE